MTEPLPDDVILSVRDLQVSARSDQGLVECVVRNLSSKGARLAFANVAAVPAKFQLKVGPSGDWRNATVRWRRGNEVGVSFDR